MARTINYRVKPGPGALQRAVIDESALPQSITGLVNGTTYEVDVGNGVWVDVTPEAAVTFSVTRIGAQAGYPPAANPSYTFDLSAGEAGDQVLVVAGWENSTAAAAVLATVQGETGPSPLLTALTGTNGPNGAVYEHTLVGAGSASAVFQFTADRMDFNVEVFLIKGGVRDGVSQNRPADGSFPSLSAITPSNANNVSICAICGRSATTDVTFSNMTEQFDANVGGTGARRVASAFASDVALSPFTPAGSVSVGFRKVGFHVMYSEAP